MNRLSELIEVGKPVIVEYVVGDTVIIRACWCEVDAAFGWGLVGCNSREPLLAAQDVLLDKNWRIVDEPERRD